MGIIGGIAIANKKPLLAYCTILLLKLLSLFIILATLFAWALQSVPIINLRGFVW